MSGAYYGDFRPGQVVRCRFNTVNTSSVPTTLSSGSVKVTKDGVEVTPSGGVTLAVDVGGEVGRHHVVLDLSLDATTFSAGSDYAIRLAGTSNVAGYSVVGVVVGEFSIANRAVAPQTGDAYARLGAPAGASLAADVATRATAGAVWDLASAGHVAAGSFGVLAADKLGFKLAADGMDSIVVEAGINARQALAVIGAATAGKAAGLDTATASYYAMGLAGTATSRITATTDQNGNRTAIALVVP